MGTKLLTEYNLEFLRLKGGWSCSSESTLVKMPHCLKSHVAAQSWRKYRRVRTVCFTPSGYITYITHGVCMRRIWQTCWSRVRIVPVVNKMTSSLDSGSSRIKARLLIRSTVDPPVKRHLNGVLLAGRYM